LLLALHKLIICNSKDYICLTGILQHDNFCYLPQVWKILELEKLSTMDTFFSIIKKVKHIEPHELKNAEVIR